MGRVGVQVGVDADGDVDARRRRRPSGMYLGSSSGGIVLWSAGLERLLPLLLPLPLPMLLTAEGWQHHPAPLATTDACLPSCAPHCPYALHQPAFAGTAACTAAQTHHCPELPAAHTCPSRGRGLPLKQTSAANSRRMHSMAPRCPPWIQTSATTGPTCPSGSRRSPTSAEGSDCTAPSLAASVLGEGLASEESVGHTGLTRPA